VHVLVTIFRSKNYNKNIQFHAHHNFLLQSFIILYVASFRLIFVKNLGLKVTLQKAIKAQRGSRCIPTL